VYFHRFDAAQSNPETFTGWEHGNDTPTSSQTLTQLVIHRFRATDQDNADLLDVYAGFYTAGPDEKTFTKTNEVRLHGNDVLKDFWSIDFSSLYKERLTKFWADSTNDFRTLAKCNFLLNAVQARDKRQLSDEDFQFVTNAVMGPITWPVSLRFLQSKHSVSDCIRTLDVAEYVATDVLRFVAPKGRQIVYMPGNDKPFQVFETAIDMHHWVLLWMDKSPMHESYMAHFSLADRQAIETNLTDLMNRLVATWGKYDHHMINQKNLAISGDAFDWIRDSTKNAMSAEAELSLTSNGDLRKKLWIGYLSAGVKVFGPMAVVGWPVALPVVGASIANMGLNIDQAVNAKTTAERKAGVIGAVLAGIDVLFNLLVLKGPGSLQEIGPEVDAAEAKEMADLKEATQPSKAPEPTPVETPVETPLDLSAEVESTAKIPDTFKIDIILSDDMLVREPGKLKGTYQLTSNPSSAIKINDNAYYVRSIDDLNGGSRWAIVDPANPFASSGSIPVRLNANGKWEVLPRLGLRGGMDVPPVPVDGTSTAPAVDDWARTPGIHIPGLTDPEMRAWALGGPEVRGQLVPAPTSIFSIDVRSVLGDSFLTRYLDMYENRPGIQITPVSEFELAQEESVDNLITDAKAYYELNPPTPRLAMSSAQLINTPSELFDTAFAEKPGLVIGEHPGSIGSKQLLIENMPALARSGVKTLYLQKLLANVNQLDLDTFARTGEMTEELETYLKKLDIHAGNDPFHRFNLLELVKAANSQHVRIQALDASTTYRIIAPYRIQMPNKNHQMMRSFFASEVINFNEEQKEPAKWIALVDLENMSSFRNFQGISEQTGALSIRVEDVLPGQVSPIVPDTGLTVEYSNYSGSVFYESDGSYDFGSTRAQIKGDWRVQMPTRWTYRSQEQLRALLPETGMFTFQRYRSSILVVYRNAENGMADRVIRMTPEGRMNLDTPLRPSSDTMTVSNLEELKQALIEKGMRPMGWPEVTAEAEGAASVVEELAQVLPEVQRPTVPQLWQANEVLEGMTPESIPGKFQGIYRLDSEPSTAIMLDDMPYYVRYQSDGGETGHWAIVDPQRPSTFAGSIPVRLNAEGEWETMPKLGLKGGGNTLKGTSPVVVQPPPPAILRKPVTIYDAPDKYSLRRLALGKLETHIKMVRQPDAGMKYLTPYEEYVETRRRILSLDARNYFSRTRLFESLPARPAVPVVTPSTTAKELLEKVFETSPGLVIGESQDRIASMRFLIENMPTLSGLGVKTLYFHRLLNDFSQFDLNAFFKTGEMSDDLEEYLQQLKSDPSGKYTPLEAVKAARLNGIRIQATDCLASYRFPSVPLPDVQEQAIKRFLTRTVMQANESLNGTGKWVVLTDQENLNTFRGMPGISEMQGGIGLRIEEVLPANKLLIEADRGIDVERTLVPQPATGSSDTLFADLSLQMPLPLLERTPEELNRLLFRQGMFTFAKSNDDWTLIHRGRDGRIARTLVERTAAGQYLINRPLWPEVHQVPYTNIEEMSRALKRMGMAFVGRLPA